MTHITLMAAAPEVTLCNPKRNLRAVLAALESAKAQNADIVVFPSLCLTGASAGALLRAPMMLEAAWEALMEAAKAVPYDMLAVLSLPVKMTSGVFECAAIIENGKLAALVPRLDERTDPFRFHPGLCTGATPATHEGVPELRDGIYCTKSLARAGEAPQSGVRVIFSLESICEEGLYLCPCADSATIRSENELNRALLNARSHGATVVYASPGEGESVTDYVFEGRCAILSDGEIVSGLDRVSAVSRLLRTSYPPPPTLKPDSRFPFLSESSALAQNELLRTLPLQAIALKRRARHINASGFLVGLSGGLDSTLALLACVSAADRMNLPLKNILAVTMPGFGTGDSTKSNAEALAKTLGVAFEEIPIVEVCRRHFEDIRQSESDYSVTFENAQARLRTLTLLDIANQRNLLFVGPGDLSELALGWTTFGGDHLSSYAINGSIPKTLVRKVIELASWSIRFKSARKTLLSILGTPVSPELLPGGANAQPTESILGDYALHDFFIYHMLKSTLAPQELLISAQAAFNGLYLPEQIEKALRTLLARFFKQQFKRNCMPEGPQITAVSLSPRALLLPSDIDGELFQL